MTISSTDIECVMAEETKYAYGCSSYVRINRHIPYTSIIHDYAKKLALSKYSCIPNLSKSF